MTKPYILEYIDQESFKPSILTCGSRPAIVSSQFNTPQLQEAVLFVKNRAIMFGNSHGLILPMMKLANKQGVLDFPLAGAIINFDYHVDTFEYGAHMKNHEATWQRFGVQETLWKPEQSYNCQPRNTAAFVHNDARKFTSVLFTDQLPDLRTIDVCSIDLDYFLGFDLDNTDTFLQDLTVIKDIIKRSKLVCVFSSSLWTKKNGIPTISNNQMLYLINEIQSEFEYSLLPHTG